MASSSQPQPPSSLRFSPALIAEATKHYIKNGIDPNVWPADLNLLQFKLTLGGMEQKIWRRFQISSYSTFWEFHWSIQNMMGWTDQHLFRFRIKNPLNGTEVIIGKPFGKYKFWYVDEAVLSTYEKSPENMAKAGFEPYGKAFCAWNVKTNKYFNEQTANSAYEVEYIYDFGDFWKMDLEFEGVFPDPTHRQYFSLDGERAAPPEDVGGLPGFERLLNMLKKSNQQRSAEEKELFEWLCERKPMYNPEVFDPKAVVFIEPLYPFIYHKQHPIGYEVIASAAANPRQDATKKRLLAIMDTFYGREKGTFAAGTTLTLSLSPN